MSKISSIHWTPSTSTSWIKEWGKPFESIMYILTCAWCTSVDVFVYCMSLSCMYACKDQCTRVAAIHSRSKEWSITILWDRHISSYRRRQHALQYTVYRYHIYVLSYDMRVNNSCAPETLNHSATAYCTADLDIRILDCGIVLFHKYSLHKLHRLGGNNAN